MFIIQGLLNTPSLVLYGSKNRLKTCERSDARSAIDCSPTILQNEKTVQVDNSYIFYYMFQVWENYMRIRNQACNVHIKIQDAQEMYVY